MKIVRDSFDPQALPVQESLFHVANGYLGVRGCFEEGYPPNITSIRGCYINAIYDDVPLQYAERLYGFPETAQRIVNLPDVQDLRLRVDGEAFSPFTGRVSTFRRTLDTGAGTAERLVEWESSGGHRLRLRFTRMASFARPELFFTRLEVENLGGACALEVRAAVNCDISNFADEGDPRIASERIRHILYDGCAIQDGCGLAECHTAASGLRMAVAQQLVGGSAPAHTAEAPTGFESTLCLPLPAGGRATIDKLTCLADSRRTGDPAAHAASVLRACREAGGERLLAEQAAYLANFWRTSLAGVEGDEAADEGIRFGLYGLLQSAGRDAISNVPAKGLSGEGYEGHYFWDTEVYILPFFLLTQPHMARRLLSYRYTILDAARAHARLMGHKRGALYAWRTITGSECSAFFPAGSAQYHINGDVAHSFLDYFDATGDLAFMAEKGAEVLLETARLWLDVGHFARDGSFRIDRVTGPDEYSCVVNNNFYTNCAARYNLLGAVRVYKALEAAGLAGPLAHRLGLTGEELAEFRRAADAMYLPYDEALGIHAQDDGFLGLAPWDFENTPPESHPLLLHYHPLYLYRHQVLKQADTVLAHYLFGEGVDANVKRRSFAYYEPLTTHDSSLSRCIYSIAAAELGQLDKAYAHYLDTLRTDLDNTHGNTRDGVHTANMGGAYLGLVAGFAGLRIQPDGPHFTFTLPAAWQGYHFSICWRGCVLQVRVSAQGAALGLAEGEGLGVFVNGKLHTIGKTPTVLPLAEAERA